MKLAAYSLILGIGVATIGGSLAAGLTAASEYSDAEARIDDLSIGMLEIDRHHGLAITLDSTLGSAALWQTAFGDLTGDGIDDLVIGLPLASPDGISEAGMVAVIYGRHGGYDAPIELSSLDASDGFLIKGSQPGARLGWSLAILPDFNDSGFSDLAIGAPRYQHENGVGAVHLLFGQPDFPARITIGSLEAGHGFTVLGGDGSGSFGFSMAALEDFNGSGYSDLAIGDPDAVVDGRSAAGSVQLLFGGVSGFPARTTQSDLDPSAGGRIVGERASQLLGLSLSAAGDLNNDGYGDLLIGAPGGGGSQTKSTAGAAYLVYGGVCNQPGPCRISSLVAEHAVEFSAGAPGDQFGLAVGWVKDEAGPGHLVIGAPMSDVDDQSGAGAVYVIPGNPALPPGAIDLGDPSAVEFLKFSGEHNDGRMGWSLYTGGDFNLDGRKDLVVGGPTDFAGSRHHPFSTRYLHVPGKTLPLPDKYAAEAARESADGSRATQMVFDARGLTRERGTANWAMADAGRLAGDDRAFVLFGERPLNAESNDAESENDVSRLYAYPAQVRSEHGPEINGGDGIENQILRAGETAVINFVVSENGQNPDDFDYQVGAELVTGFEPTLVFEFGGTGTDRTLTINSQDNTDFAGLLVITVIVTDPDGNSTQEQFVLGFSHEFGPGIDPLSDLRTYDNRNVSVLFSFNPFPNTVDGGSSEEAVVLGEAVNVTADTGGNGFLDIASAELNPGQTIIWVYAAIVNGNNDEAYSGFILDVFEPTDPYINDGEGIASPQSVTEGKTLTIPFIIGDLVDPPEDLDVRVFSGDENVVSNADMTLGCVGENCTLEITPQMGTGGTLVQGMQLAVCYPDCFEPSRSSTSVFDLDILERQPPTINGGAGVDDQLVTEGQSIVVPFTIEDDFDDPEMLQVEVFELNAALDPAMFDVVCVGGDCDLTITSEMGMSRVDPYEVAIEVTNSDNLSSQETFALTIEERSAPTINEGAGLGAQSVIESQSVTIGFTVEDELDDPDTLNVTVTAGELDGGIFTLTCAAGDCELTIDTEMGLSRADPYEIVVEVANPSSGLSNVALFDLLVLEREGPLINDGEPIPDRAVGSGETVTVVFTVSDQLDDPDQIAVSASSTNEEVLPQDALQLDSPCVLGECELLLEIPELADGTVEIVIVAANSDDIETQTSFNLLIELQATPPVINDGEPLADLQIYEGQSQSIEFSVTEEIETETLSVQVASENELIIGDDDLLLTSIGNDLYELVVQTRAGSTGTAGIVVTASNLAGEEKRTFEVEVRPRPAPRINGSAGLFDRQGTAGTTLEFSFTVTDLIDPATEISTTAQSMNQAIIPADSLSLTGTGSERILSIDIPEGQTGVVEIVVVATNSAGRSRSASFDLTIGEGRQPPVINHGQPLEDQMVMQGGTLTIVFDVEDAVDAPELISVDAHSGNQAVIDDDALEIESDGVTRSLTIDATDAGLGNTEITVEAINSAGLVAVATFQLLIVEEDQTELSLEIGHIDGPHADDVYLVISVENIGEHAAALIELDGFVVEGDYSVLGGYSLAPSCTAEEGEVACDSSLIPPWVCAVEGDILFCTLTELPVQGVASLVMHLEGDGAGQAAVAVEARNSSPVSSAEEIGN